MLLTRSPLSPGPKAWFSLDLHVLSAPPAFVLSQDQTLREDGLPAKESPAIFFTLSLCSKSIPIEQGCDRFIRFLPGSEESVRSRRKRTLLSFQRPSLLTAKKSLQLAQEAQGSSETFVVSAAS